MGVTERAACARRIRFDAAERSGARVIPHPLFIHDRTIR